MREAGKQKWAEKHEIVYFVDKNLFSWGVFVYAGG